MLMDLYAYATITCRQRAFSDGVRLNSTRTECMQQAHQFSPVPPGFPAVLGQVVRGSAFVARVEWRRTVRRGGAGKVQPR